MWPYAFFIGVAFRILLYPRNIWGFQGHSTGDSRNYIYQQLFWYVPPSKLNGTQESMSREDYQVLGANPGYSARQLRQALQSRADELSPAGLSIAMQLLTSRKRLRALREVTEAYVRLIEARGFDPNTGKRKPPKNA